MMRQIVNINLKFILIVVVVLFKSFVFGQTKTDDDLYVIWADKSKPEAERLEVYLERMGVDSLAGQEADWSKKWIDASLQAIDLALKLDKKEHLSWLYTLSLKACADSSECRCNIAKKAIESARAVNPSGVAPDGYLVNVMIRNCGEEEYLKEIERIKASLTDRKDDITLLRNINRDLGETYAQKSQFPKSLRYYHESMKLSEQIKLIDLPYARICADVGGIHLLIENYGEAEKYLSRSVEISHQLKDTYNLGSTFLTVSQLQIKFKDDRKAQLYIDSALYIMKNVKHCEVCYNVARIHNAANMNLRGDFSGALSELTEPEVYFEVGKYPEQLPRLYIAKATAYLGLKRYDEAIAALRSSRELVKTYTEFALDLYDVLVKSYEGKGDYRGALEHYKIYTTVKDSLAAWRSGSEATRVEIENQFTHQQLETELKYQAQISRQKATRNWIMFLGILALLFALGLYSRLRFTRKTQKLLQKKNEIIEAEKEKAQASEKAKHQFLANMSHEIRTPMNAIKGMTDILIRRNPKDDQKEYLEGIKQSSDSLLVIINDILDISKIEAGKVELEMQPFSVNELVDNVHTIMQFKAEEKGLELKKDVPSESLYVKGDATRLRQILINLIGNAIKFTDKGVVTTSLKSEKSGDGLNLHFTVSDTGIGIDEDRMDKIFKSFEQAYSDTSRKFGGTGLGLSISKMLVELHGGRIWVESVKGKGSQFHFTIPYEITELSGQQAKVENSNVNITDALKGIRILLVEDNQFNAVVAQEELEDAIEGVIVELAENGLIAVEKLKSAAYDVILMDVQMPIMNGFEATMAIRNLDPEKANTPIIAMTANVLKEEVDLCYEAGMNDFIGKPFDTEELIQKIYNLVKTKS
ncbi:MAG: response regulator [Saprospiraceae bacterium]|nr:response regulator [Saprospiraceae bacterium]